MGLVSSYPTNFVSSACAGKMPAEKISSFAAPRPAGGAAFSEKDVLCPPISTVYSSQRRRGWLWSAAFAGADPTPVEAHQIRGRAYPAAPQLAEQRTKADTRAGRQRKWESTSFSFIRKFIGIRVTPGVPASLPVQPFI